MADTKITDLTEDTTPLATDLLVTVDDPGGSPVNKKATIANVIAAVISAWAKAATKPTYANTEVGAAPTVHTHVKASITDFPTSMPASDVSAWAKSGTKPSYTYGEVGAPSTSDARLSNARPASDVSAWAKAASKPAYTAAEVGSKKITTGSFTASGTTKVVTHGLGSTPSFAMVICATAGHASVVGASEFGFTTFFVAYLTSGTDYLWIAFA